MKKYLFILKTTLIDNLQYVSSIILGFISFTVMMFIFLNLWRYIYSDTSALIKGYTINQMIWYVVVTEMIWFGTRNKSLTNEISDDIKSGKIAYHMNKPYSYIMFIISKYMGEIIFKFAIFMSFSILLGFILIGGLHEFSIMNIPLLVIVFLFGAVINALIRIGISLTSFWIEESAPFHWIYDKLILVIGTIFPIELFPLWIQPIIRYTPIFVVTYGPAKLVVDFSMNMFYAVLLIQIIYLIVCTLVVMLLYRRGVKKLNVNGG